MRPKAGGDRVMKTLTDTHDALVDKPDLEHVTRQNDKHHKYVGIIRRPREPYLASRLSSKRRDVRLFPDHECIPEIRPSD